MIKCKGCTGQIEYIPLAKVRERGLMEQNAGPALLHDPATPCKWFLDVSLADALAYINVAEYKTSRQVDGGQHEGITL